METTNEETLEMKAEKFQRLMQGCLLLTSYVFQYLPLAILVTIIMILSCFTDPKFTPFYQLYMKLFRKPNTPVILFAGENGASRFACALGAILLVIGLILFYLGSEKIAWAVIITVGTLSILAGTIGFCLGAVIYAMILNKVNHREN